MPLPEEQQYIKQIAILQKKINHFEEAMKLEEEEKKITEKIDFHKANFSKEAELEAKKDEENAFEQFKLRQEEEERHEIIQKMVHGNDDSLSSIKEVLVHFEGSYLVN